MNRQTFAALLRRHEGMVLHAYADSLGYTTIGIGRCIDKRVGGGISASEAWYLLQNDISRIEGELDRELPWWRDLDDVRQLVLASMCFQMGVGKLLRFTNTLAAIKDGRWADAGLGVRSSLWYRQTPRRAEEMAVMLETGQMAESV